MFLWCAVRLLEYCREHGAYTGCELSKIDDDIDEEMINRLSDMTLVGMNTVLFFARSMIYTL